MQAIETQTELYLDQLHDLFAAESQIGLTVGWLAEVSTHESLNSLLRHHETQTDRQKERILKVFYRYDSEPNAGTCERVLGLINAGNEQILQSADPSIRDRNQRCGVAVDPGVVYQNIDRSEFLIHLLDAGSDRVWIRNIESCDDGAASGFPHRCCGLLRPGLIRMTGHRYIDAGSRELLGYGTADSRVRSGDQCDLSLLTTGSEDRLRLGSDATAAPSAAPSFRVSGSTSYGGEF